MVILGQAQRALWVPPITKVKSEDPQASWPCAGSFPFHSRARPGLALQVLACLSQELQPKAQAASCLLLQPNCSWIQFKFRLEVDGRRRCTAPGRLHHPHRPQSGCSQAPAHIVTPVTPSAQIPVLRGLQALDPALRPEELCLREGTLRWPEVKLPVTRWQP